MAVSSINFQKSSEHSYDHNFRYDSPNYLLKEEDRLENSYWENDLSAKEIFNNELSRSNRRGGRIPKFENSHWEAVLNLNKEHTLDDVKKVADYLENKLNITCATISVHRDEGHYKKNGKVCYNFHAHLTFVTYKDGQQNWRQEKVRKKLGEIQTEVAKILKMERGQENSKKTRLSAKQYKKVAQELETKDNVIQAKNQTLNKKLKEEWLTKKQIADLIEAKRKSMLQENKKLEEANQQPIYNAENYKDLRSLGEELKGQDITIEQLEEQIEELLQLAREKAKEEQLKEIEALKAENNEIKAQEYTLTQEQIQEIINQALAQKNAEIAEKDKVIQTQNQKILELQAKNSKISDQEQEEYQENMQTPNNEELTENNRKQAIYALNHIIKDDVSAFQTTNTDKTEVPKQNQTHNEKKYFQLSDFIQIQDDVSELQAKNTDKTEISEQYQEEDQEQEQNNNKSKTNIRRY
ncbi:hypothetical protein FUB63_08415 [Campylobacter coli]|nr:hypothetical protein [Campylobacter coli]